MLADFASVSPLSKHKKGKRSKRQVKPLLNVYTNTPWSYYKSLSFSNARECHLK